MRAAGAPRRGRRGDGDGLLPEEGLGLGQNPRALERRQVEAGRRSGGGQDQEGGAQAHSKSSGSTFPLGPFTKWWKARALSAASAFTSQASPPAARAWRTRPAAG